VGACLWSDNIWKIWGHAPGMAMFENVGGMPLEWQCLKMWGACPWDEDVLKMWGHAPRMKMF